MANEAIGKKIDVYSQRVVRRYHPRMIVLYGSYANGTATEDSDIDIAVVCDSLEGNYFEHACELFKMRRDIDLRIEPLLIELDENENRFVKKIIETGKVVYGAVPR